MTLNVFGHLVSQFARTEKPVWERVLSLEIVTWLPSFFYISDETTKTWLLKRKKRLPK